MEQVAHVEVRKGYQPMKIFGIGIMVIGVSLILLTERCRRNPYRCASGFASNEGFTRSFVVLRYWRRSPEERREIFLNDSNVRKIYLIESYSWGILAFFAGILLFTTS